MSIRSDLRFKTDLSRLSESREDRRMAQSKVPRLLSTFVLTSGTGLASYYGYVQNQKDPHNHPETDETPTPESADASVKQELEQSPYRHLRQKLSQKSVQAMHLLPKFPDLISSTLHAAQASPELVSPTTLSLLLNITSLDQCPHCSALYFQTLDSICASSEKHVAQVAEVSTRYGSWTLWHLAKHHAQVPTLGPSLAKLTRDESRHLCHFGPSHLVSCLRLLDHHQSNNDTDQNSNEIPSEYQEFAWWALHRACGRGRRSSRYRLRKNVIGDDRVPRTRRVVLSHPHLWNILHKGEFASPECELLAAKLVAELSLEPSDIWTDKRKLDMIGRWLESPASTDLRKAALMTLRNLAFQTSTEIRQALVQTGMPTRVYALMVEHPELRPLSIEFLSTMLNDDESSSDLDTLTLSCVQVKTWHEAEDHALQVETYVPRLLDFLCQEVFTKPEIAKTRGARKVDVETQANVVLCFERLARRVFAPDVMYQWLSCLVERGLAQSATLELDHTQVIQQRRQRSDREHPMESQAPAYQASLTELLDHLAPLCEDSGFLNEVFFPGGGPGLLASIGHQIIVAACAEETKYHRENESKELVSLKQQWCRCMANVLAQEISESSGSARKSSLDTLVQASALSLSWEMSNDIKLRSLATRVGANVAALDQAKETPPPVLYQDGVNPLYISSHHKKIQGEFDRDHVEVDVVLIHGLLGSAFSTWKTGQSQKTDENQTQHIWPCQWLVDDLEAENIRPRVLSISYEANVFSSSTPWPSLTLEQRAQKMLMKLSAAGLGQRPIVFITHSMGGILLKEMLACAQASEQSELSKATLATVFYAVPHGGSPLASIFQEHTNELTRSLLRPHPALKDMHAGAGRLETLRQAFPNHIRVCSLGEARATALPFFATETIVVPAESANPGMGIFHLLSEADHMDICKPVSNLDPRYRIPLEFIVSCVKDSSNRVIMSEKLRLR